MGRFLEHGRAYYFRNGGSEEIYLGSADLMRRNLSHRVEIIFPVSNPGLVRRLKDILQVQLADGRKSYHLYSEGYYLRSIQPEAFDSQLHFLTQEREVSNTAKGLSALSHKPRAAER